QGASAVQSGRSPFAVHNCRLAREDTAGGGGRRSSSLARSRERVARRAGEASPALPAAGLPAHLIVGPAASPPGTPARGSCPGVVLRESEDLRLRHPHG